MNPKDFEKAIITISKEKLASLPLAEYSGKIVVVDSQEKLQDSIDSLLEAPIIGFDTETRPSFKKGQYHHVALIQLATPDSCYLFRTNIIGYPKALTDILEDPRKLKVGLSIHDDFHSLRKVTEIEPQGFIDLQNFVKNYKIADNSLSRLYGILFNERISKSQRLTNWESPTLTESQQGYAALDAYACIRIYNHLTENMFDPRESEYLTIPPEPEEEQEIL